MKKKKLPLVCWDSIKLLTALFLLWGVCFGADAYPEVNIENNFLIMIGNSSWGIILTLH
ncbi:hypothetical protein QNN11_01975 [Phocaeicola dorei]|uniref:Uncharacterized protein n=1 Tax=Phocaeicola dorei TaxID=357276 RepID=A0AA95HVL6_9BACT|nr:hypothetical protein QNN11_01975 [Phocaeicola dorei]